MSDNIGANIAKLFSVLDVGRRWDEQSPRGTLLWQLRDRRWPDRLAYWWSEHCPERWLPEPKIKQPSFEDRSRAYFAQLQQITEDIIRQIAAMNQHGFTLLELLIVLAIVGILVGVVALGAQDVARVAIGG